MDILPFHRKTSAVVDLNALRTNLSTLRKHLGPTKICAVVKANAYGHGDLPIARELERNQVAWFAVALVEEGIRLRNGGIKSPILILGGALGDDYDALVRYRLTPAIFSAHHLDELNKAVGAQIANFHLKIDTGMSRLGLRYNELLDFLNHLKKYPNLRLDGVFTHLANADLRDSQTNEKQLTSFTRCQKIIKDQGFTPRWCHVSNSAGTLTQLADQGNLVRVGISLYGLDPVSPPTLVDLQPTLAWKTSVIHIKTIPTGSSVSYGGAWTAKQPSRIATLPVGYADGYCRALGDQAQVLVHGQRVPIVGNICMDLCMADVSQAENVKIGDEIVLVGPQGSEFISANELASWSNTIAYEIITGISYRVPRQYEGIQEGG